MTDTPNRRRSDRVVAADYLDGLADRSLEELRGMRDDCRDEETRLSYVRRVLHAQIDVARSEVTRRRDRGDASENLIAALPGILADAPVQERGPGQARPLAFYDPSEEAGRRAEDGLLDQAALGRLPDLSDEELTAIIEQLADSEQRISRLRRIVLDHLDRLQAELVRRFRDDASAVDEIVSRNLPG